MKRCLNDATVQAWLDRELSPEASAAAQLHLSTCDACAARVRDAEAAMGLIGAAWQASLPPAAPAVRLQARVEARMAQPERIGYPWWRAAFAQWQIGAAVGLLVLVVAAAAVMRSSRGGATEAVQIPEAPQAPSQAARPIGPAVAEYRPAVPAQPAVKAGNERSSARPAVPVPAARRVSSPNWLEAETSKHLEQAQVLLRSIRNAEDADQDIDYERELSRELLSRNRLLRRSAERKDGRRAEELLSRIEPILLDIANLPQMAAADDMRPIQEQIRAQQIIAELQLYSGRNLF